MKTQFLIGKRIYFRPLEREDAPTLELYFNDPDVTRTLRFRGAMNLQDEEEFVDRIRKSTTDICLGIVLKEKDRLIGTVGLHGIEQRCRHAEFGIAIGDKEEWDKGYGSEATELILAHAFETLNLHRIELRVYEYNLRGIKAYERVGFKREGVLRQETYRTGRYWDTIVMSMLRPEWDELNRAAK